MRQFGGPDPAQMQKALEMYQAAGNDQDKEKARKSLAEMLSQYFEADMKQRESEIEAIEARVQKLRAQLNKRAEAQGEIVDLQLKVLINQADGLGFYSQQGSNSRLDGFSGGGRPETSPTYENSPTYTLPQSRDILPEGRSRDKKSSRRGGSSATQRGLILEERETAPAEEAEAEKTPAASVETPAQESSKPTLELN